jgi:predicted nuclease of predicted toxin-antitoxin system
MALRFLADHCIPNSIVETLRDANHEVFRLRDVLPVEAPDAIVIAKAQEIDASLILERRLCRYRDLSAQELQRGRRPPDA